ncbi:MAG: rhodanese-like domain-containing protein [Candidatus Methanomethylicus sp.]|nr:rhodanese-like domain-containing protein [Candidatus Methanomethylicus sp.]
MGSKSIILVIAMLVVAGIVGVVYLMFRNPQSGPASNTSLPSGDITAQTAWQMINNASFSNLVIVDVRTPSEFSTMHLINAVNIPYYNNSDFSTRLGSLAGKGNTEIILYCGSGVRSHNAWLYMNSTGNYSRLYNMLGGISGWVAAKYTVWREP